MIPVMFVYGELPDHYYSKILNMEKMGGMLIQMQLQVFGNLADSKSNL